MSEARTGALLGKRSGWLRWALVACAALAAIVAAAWFTTPWYVRTRLLPDLWEQYELTVTAERQDLSIADGATEMYGVRVLDGEEEILTAKRLEVQVSLRGLYAGRTVVERVVLDDPVLHLRIDAEGRTNVGKILERRTHGGTTPRPATLWKEAVAHGGKIEWDDRARRVRLRFRDIEAEARHRGRGSRHGDGQRRAAGPLWADQHRCKSRAAEPTVRAAFHRLLGDRLQ